jgi:hypothetical protein
MKVLDFEIEMLLRCKIKRVKGLLGWSLINSWLLHATCAIYTAYKTSVFIYTSTYWKIIIIGPLWTWALCRRTPPPIPWDDPTGGHWSWPIPMSELWRKHQISTVICQKTVGWSPFAVVGCWRLEIVYFFYWRRTDPETSFDGG